ncbi:MAG: 2-amino-4-hydroxy-6-hydroxymethyldihydropteridine diphosphokinase [Chthonomonadales bacterium]
MSLAYLSLGSNLGDRQAHIAAAIRRLAAPGLRVTGVSSIYETEPVGYTPEPVPKYLNCVVQIHTRLSPEELLRHAQSVERAGGRTSTFRWGPRTIDVDLLLYDDLAIATPLLTIPHPRLKERAFVLVPLFELDPNLVLPGGSPIRAALEAPAVRAQGIHRVGPADVVLGLVPAGGE